MHVLPLRQTVGKLQPAPRQHLPTVKVDHYRSQDGEHQEAYVACKIDFLLRNQVAHVASNFQAPCEGDDPHELRLAHPVANGDDDLYANMALGEWRIRTEGNM